ncbi:hypothetical protein ACFP1H_04125 [Secundilactobacillus hailunensis]|uniref:D-alanyl-D-alanine carboxypeptidase n=1 Tax=Secundilactobacillus hailunensis TaxID=2559923 RepID=A0ABW1T842_9LACO|nr:hypothetical protein [Secundilactobacillus hailunensis]
MNLKKQLGLSLVVGSGLLLGLSATPANAQARTYVRYYENIPNKTVSVTNKNAYVYNNGCLSRKMGTMRYYGSKVEEYYAAHVTKNGKTSVYYKFRVGHRTGWVWHGYLKSIASSTGTTTPTNGTNTQTTSGKSIAPGTTVENEDWNALARRDGVYSDTAAIMQMFPKTIYNQKVEEITAYSWNTTDEADFDDSDNGINQNSWGTGVNMNGFVAIRFRASTNKLDDYAAIEKALDKAGYDANARAKFAGWSIGAQYEEPGNTDEGPQGGMGLVLLVPNP